MKDKKIISEDHTMKNILLVIDYSYVYRKVSLKSREPMDQ